MDPIPLPAPYGGANTKIPLIALQSPQCEVMFNFNSVQEGVSLRNGDSLALQVAQTTPIASYPRGFGVFNNVPYFWASNANTSRTNFYNGLTGAIIGSSSPAGGASYLYKGLNFNGYILFLTPDGDSPGHKWDGTTFSALGYTGASLTPYNGAVYKNRAYLSQYASPDYWYSGIDSIAGALTKVSMAGIISEYAYLADIGVITLSDNVSAVLILCLIYESGEVLFYSGSYPNSSDWSIVGRATIGRPFRNGQNIPYGGDFLVITDTGLFSLRDVFTKGKGTTSLADLSLSDPINKEWITLASAFRVGISGVSPSQSVQGVWDRATSRIIVMFPMYFDSSNVLTFGATFFVYDTSLGSWKTHNTKSLDAGITTAGNAPGALGLCVANNKVYFLGANTAATFIGVFQKEGSSGFVDTTAANASATYDYEIKSAPIAQGRTYVQKGEGMDLIVETDLYAQTQYKLIRDLGVSETNSQLVPTQPTGLQKSFVNIGIEGSFIQYKISGTTTTGKTVGYALYGVNFWVEQGGSPR